MTKSLSFTVLSPDSVIFEAENVTKVRARLRGDTWLSVYPGHAPLLAETLPGKLEYEINEHQSELILSAGILQVKQNHITVFVSKAHLADDNMDDSDAGRVERYDKLSRMLMQSLDAQY